jgi:hypothetical protein
MVLTACSVLFPVIGFLATVASAMRKHRRQRDASIEAPEPHGLAVRCMRIRRLHNSVHRIPRPTSVTIAIRPSWRAQDG